MEQEQAKITVGEEVWVKLPDAWSTTRWGSGTVTEVLFKKKMTVDGVARRVSLPSDEEVVDEFPGKNPCEVSNVSNDARLE